MSGIVPTIAGAIRRLKPEQRVELLCELTRGYEINLNLNAAPETPVPGIPAGSVLLPLRMTPEMIETARHHSWTALSYERKLQKMWDAIVEVGRPANG